ncbi:MAG: hypothetical protein OEZ01_10535 [Candidatus Heimdallarchaeota archaeon]|nr:hypothetical protein [Candidatus Heimdallarchaeota archaeon]MDH5646437.1 hypothetical protein [Candidatus Heimdallarchaeota archaeon]
MKLTFFEKINTNYVVKPTKLEYSPLWHEIRDLNFDSVLQIVSKETKELVYDLLTSTLPFDRINAAKLLTNQSVYVKDVLRRVALLDENSSVRAVVNDILETNS